MSREPERWASWLVAISLAWAATAVILVLGSRVRSYLGPRGMIATERLMGMVLVAIAVQMFLSGAERYVGQLPRDRAAVSVVVFGVTPEGSRMAAKFEIKKASNNQFYFNLKAANGQVILTSEQYKQKAKAETGITSVKTNAANDARFERKTSNGGQPYFVLKAGNGEIVGRSEMYSSAAAMEKGIASVKANAAAAVRDLT
jgi:uncharacterized protein YegP (UPF0339 family)